MKPKKERFPIPELTADQEAALEAIEAMPYREENSSPFIVNSHTVNIGGEAIKIHEVNNFPTGFLRKYFDFINEESDFYSFNPVEVLGPWVPIMEILKEKFPDIYDSLNNCDNVIRRLIEAENYYQTKLSQAPQEADIQKIIREDMRDTLRAINNDAWPTVEDVAKRDTAWAKGYDTICEIAKVVRHDFNPSELTVPSYL